MCLSVSIDESLWTEERKGKEKKEIRCEFVCDGENGVGMRIVS